MIVSNFSHSNSSGLKTVLKAVSTNADGVYVLLILTGDCFIPTNYQKIFASISAIPLAQAHIQFNTVMSSIETVIDRPRPILLTTADGKKQYFDAIVVTTPLGWLKKHKESIHELHPRISSAIDSISFGRLEKVDCHYLSTRPRTKKPCRY